MTRLLTLFALTLLILPAGLPGQVAETPSIEELHGRVESLRDGGDPREVGMAWRELALAYRGAERFFDALAADREAVDLLETTSDMAERAEARNQLGLTHWQLAQYDSAVRHLDEARSLWARLDDRPNLGRVYNNLGTAHYQWGNYEPALDAFLRALAFRREVGDETGEALVLANVGLTYHDWAQYDRAREALEESIRIADRIQATFVQGYARLTMGRLHLTLEDWDRAEEAYEASMVHYGEGAEVNSLAGIAMARVGRGDPESALPLLERMLESSEGGLFPRREARALLHLGETYRALGDHDRAIGFLDRGLEVALEWDQRPLALVFLSELADLHELRGDGDQALMNLRAHLALRDTIFDQSAVQRIAAMEGRIAAERQEVENVRLREEQRAGEAVIARQRVIVILGSGLLLVSLLLLAVVIHFNRTGRERETLLGRTNAALAQTNGELRNALAEVRTLKGFIPICSHCKKVRDDEGYWESVESYITSRSDAFFSHSICMDCGPRVFGRDWAESGAGGDRDSGAKDTGVREPG
jgi:tetratricopeptide (TPR) repeat protein